MAHNGEGTPAALCPKTSLTQRRPPPKPSYPLFPQQLGFNRSSLAVSLRVKAAISTDFSWAFCQGMKDMIDNNGRKTRGFKGFVGILLMNRLRDMNSKHEELKALVVSYFNRRKSYLWLIEAFSCTLKESKK